MEPGVLRGGGHFTCSCSSFSWIVPFKREKRSVQKAMELYVVYKTFFCPKIDVLEDLCGEVQLLRTHACMAVELKTD